MYSMLAKEEAGAAAVAAVAVAVAVGGRGVCDSLLATA